MIDKFLAFHGCIFSRCFRSCPCYRHAIHALNLFAHLILYFTLILLCYYNYAGVNELVVALEQVGAGGDVLLREASQRPTATIPQR